MAPAFSLIELMIAIVILGFGMVMAATMFPVGWMKAREMADNSSRLTMVENALTQLTLTATVDGERYEANTFAGDLFVYIDPVSFMEVMLSDSDTLVHALNMENRLITGEFVPETPLPDDADRLDRLPLGMNVGDLPPKTLNSSFLTPRLKFHDRWHPPMRAYAGEDPTDPEGDKQWEAALDTRNHAWAVLHRLREKIVPGPGGLLDGVGRTRSFDVYFVTFRRGRSTLRFAQQDSDAERTPNPFQRAEVVEPRAKPADQDTILPTPWRVQVGYDAAKMNARDKASGVPTEIRIPPEGATSAYPDFIVDMFQEGTYFVDELNGQVFKVVERREAATSGGFGDAAFLTLDREVFIEDIDDGETPGDLVIEDEGDEATRTVWVFPPAAEPTRVNATTPVFSGPPPVIGIDVRTIHVSPRTK